MHKLFLLLTLSCTTILQSQTPDTTQYIVLKSEVDGLNRPNAAQVAFYVDVADSLNAAGINFRVVATRARGDTSAINWVTGSLLDSLSIGAKIEVVRTVRFDPGLPKGQKQGIIDNYFLDNLADFLEKWYAEFDFHGLERAGL